MPSAFIAGSVILITGGTGSLGQAIVAEVLKSNPRSIRIFSRNEYLQANMRRKFNDSRLRFMVGDVRDRERLEAVMQGVDYVIHAAALKHVLTGETNPQEVVKTNVQGSINVLEVAATCHVARVLGISSDKAVAPVSLYGMTKGVMEKMFVEANRWSAPQTLFSLMRSGNFFESSGNVFEVWDEQSKTGRITLTDAGMYRYFIKTEDAAKFALEGLELMAGGEIFVPKMREYSMLELAKKMYPECEITISGKGDGERLHESLFADGEKPEEYGNYWVIDSLKDVL